MREKSISSLDNISREELVGAPPGGAPAGVEESVREIIDAVRQKGDQALCELTERFDRVKLDAGTLLVSESEFEQAFAEVSSTTAEAIKLAIARVEAFHARQKQNSWMETGEPGVLLGQLVNPLEKVGLYVPGGSAPLVSTVIMNAVPAIKAGVPKISLVTPPANNGRINPALLVTANLLGLKNVYKVGGAQAVAALALGTESVPRVDKIVGPGNIYVATAKKLLFGLVGIDMIAGPSEILVLADQSAKPDFVAADLLSQAEHDPLSGCYLVTDSEELIKKVKIALEIQLKDLERAEIARVALKDHGLIVKVNNLEDGAAVSNIIAPEHLIVEVADPWAILGRIRNACAIFMGHFTPEAVGDYLAGPNHVLPTQGTARFFSPLGVDDFVKKSSLLSFTEESLSKLSASVLELASIEGLTAHARSVKVRTQIKE